MRRRALFFWHCKIAVFVLFRNSFKPLFLVEKKTIEILNIARVHLLGKWIITSSSFPRTKNYSNFFGVFSWIWKELVWFRTRSVWFQRRFFKKVQKRSIWREKCPVWCANGICWKAKNDVSRKVFIRTLQRVKRTLHAQCSMHPWQPGARSWRRMTHTKKSNSGWTQYSCTITIGRPTCNRWNEIDLYRQLWANEDTLNEL